MSDKADEQLAGFDDVAAFCDMLVSQRNASDHTVRNYRIDLIDYLRWADRSNLDPLEVTYKQMRGYLGELDQARYSRTTINRRLSALRGFFRWLKLEGRITNDPASVLQGPKTAKTLPKIIKPADMVRLLSVHSPDNDENNCDDQISHGHNSETRHTTGKNRQKSQSMTEREKNLKTWADMRDLALLEFLYACGARVAEASGLLLDDVDFESRQVKVMGKGQKERIIPLHDLALDSMGRYLVSARANLLGNKQSDFFFVSNRGNLMSTDAIRKMFKATVRAAGLDESLSPHAMRHTFATDMLTGGADLRSVQEMLGHASLSTTQIYTHVSIDRLKEVHSLAHPRSGK